MTTQQIPVTPAHAEILAMPHEQLQQFAVRLFEALLASHEETGHVQQVLGGWEECKDCQAANDEGDGSLCCDKAKERQRIVRAAWSLR
ncbi:hypothetical protein ACFY2M_19595 [Streptomyces sp. NPDC001276]|uniref:hypothetical protein n=1 Tax=Streptomyces sp. NPDC001276 TaxID=3364555 RepID=UPI003677156C